MRGEGDKKRWQGWNYSAHPQNKEPILTLVSPPKRFLYLFFFISYFFISYFFEVELLNSPPKQRIHPDTCVPTTKISSQNRDIASTKKYLSISKLFGDIVGMKGVSRILFRNETSPPLPIK